MNSYHSLEPAAPRISPLSVSISRILGLVKVRALFCGALAVCEMMLATWLFDFDAQLPNHLNPVYYVARSARWFIIFVAVFFLLIGPRRDALFAAVTNLQSDHRVLRAVALNLLVYSVFAAGCIAFTAHAANAISPPWGWLPGLGLLLGATALSLIGVFAPVGGLAALAWAWRSDVLTAAAASLVVVVLAELAPLLWNNLAGFTLVASAAIMWLYEPEVAIDTVARTITVGDFTAQISDACSGFEGLALVAGFVTLYLWLLRSELRFPAALLLYPIGFGASLSLNAVRVAALTSIGGHISPEMAVRGFHSQAGWIAFLMVTLGLMSLSVRFFQRRSAQPAAGRVPQVRYSQTVTHLLPFIALMLGSIVMAASAPHDRPVYVVKAGAVVLALWVIRKSFAEWRPKVSALAVGAGVAVGAAWIATDPAPGGGGALGVWLTEIGPSLAVAWLVFRAFGTVVLVPVAEELAFRGYLYRRLISRDFYSVSPATLSVGALVVSSVVFGALHDRWLAAALAGSVFALVMMRKGRLGDAVVAHGVTNALIFIWALAFRQWSLL